MDIAEQIQAIIDQRNQQAHNIESVLDKWGKLKKELEKLEGERQKYINGDSDGNSNLAIRLHGIDFSPLLNQINKQLEELENLKKRFSRSTLNIGVVGRMRQGKSRLLQSLTGLTDEEIPTGSEGICTRSLSKIFHENNPRMVKNEIEFHSWSSLKEIIHLYFDKLGLPSSHKPRFPNDLDPDKLPKLVYEKAKDANNRYQYGRLRKGYYTGYENYRAMLDGSSKQIPKEDIKKYITQIESSNNQINSEYLATKELRIYCQFPEHQEVGKIGVVDLPGLGDTIFDTELLIKTLKQDIDFILFVRRPDPVGDDWQQSDRDMYDIACQALGDFPIRQCSFMVFNRINLHQDSLEACERFQRTINSQEIEVSQSVIADCTDPDEVRREILSPVLKALTEKVNDVYKQYFLSHNQSLKKLQSEINQRLEKARSALDGYSQQGGLGFHDWFDEKLWKPLNGKILQERKILYSKQNEADLQFENEVNQVVMSCREPDVIPSEDDIEGFRNGYGDSYKIAYYMCINEVKKQLTKKFKSLAKALTESERHLQLSVVNILLEHGDLKQLTCKTNLEFFDDIEKQLPGNTESLRQAFHEIRKSTDTYEDTIIRWIQRHLNELNPDKHLDPISVDQLSPNNIDLTSEQVSELEETVYPLTPEQISEFDQSISNPTNVAETQASPINSSIAELIMKKIDSLRNQVVDDCETTLQSMLSFPNQEAYSKFDKFVTQAFRGETASREWRYFYEDENNKSILWPDAEKKEKHQQVEQEWRGLVGLAIEASQESGLLVSLNEIKN